jgi:ADP-ribose pyrophosphatase
MKWALFLGFFFLHHLFASGQDRYFSYMEKLSQPNGNFRDGEIEIVVSPEEIAQVQKVQETRLLKKGFSAEEAAEFSRVGVVNEDQYWIWLRDAVYFPKGIPGTYDRLIWKSELRKKHPGVAILPVLPSHEVVLVLHFRHATRSWELELPRGGLEAKETEEEAALRELKEETGFCASSVTLLGEMAIDTGVLSSVIPVFLAKVAGEEFSKLEYSEAIAKSVRLSKEELYEGLAQGFLEVSLNGEKKRAFLRDPFLTFGLIQAQIKSLF